MHLRLSEPWTLVVGKTVQRYPLPAFVLVQAFRQHRVGGSGHTVGHNPLALNPS
jgi:hypothetical protein